jgi:hypothetical protein
MGFGVPPLFKGAQATTTTMYVGVPIHNGVVGLHIGWLDATSAATVTLELTSFGAEDAPYDAAGAAYEWIGSGETITGPVASAAGATLVFFENVRARRARLKLASTANCLWEIYDGVDVP